MNLEAVLMKFNSLKFKFRRQIPLMCIRHNKYYQRVVGKKGGWEKVLTTFDTNSFRVVNGRGPRDLGVPQPFNK